MKALSPEKLQILREFCVEAELDASRSVHWVARKAIRCEHLLALLDERDALAEKLEVAEARADKFQALWNETQCAEFDTGYQITRKLKIAEARVEELEEIVLQVHSENSSFEEDNKGFCEQIAKLELRVAELEAGITAHLAKMKEGEIVVDNIRKQVAKDKARRL